MAHYKASTLYRTILANVAACHMPYQEGTDEGPSEIWRGKYARAAVANESIHELRRFMEFHGGDVLRPQERVWRSKGERQATPWEKHEDFAKFAAIVGENCAHSWDGVEFAYSQSINALAKWLERQGFTDPADR